MDKKAVAAIAKEIKTKYGYSDCKQTAYHGSPSVKCAFFGPGTYVKSNNWSKSRLAKYPDCGATISTDEEVAAKEAALAKQYAEYVRIAAEYAAKYNGRVLEFDKTSPDCISYEDRVVRIVFA